jgi:hypothetical protein
MQKDGLAGSWRQRCHVGRGKVPGSMMIEMNKEIVVMRHNIVGITFAACVVLLVSVLSSVSVAGAEEVISEAGEGAGETSQPEGLAVDAETGRLYVADRGNHRVDVFDSEGHFEMAFGWGVADGAAEPQTCGPGASPPTAICRKGLAGAGPGEFGSVDEGGLSSLAVDDDETSASHHDVYVADGARVQKFTPTGSFLLAWGGGVITGGAAGVGSITAGSLEVTGARTTSKTFEAGQTITGAGIPAETRIASLDAGIIVLSKPATSTASSVALSVAEGPGNVPVNERQTFTFGSFQSAGFGFRFSTPPPSEVETELPHRLPFSASASVIQHELESLSNVGEHNVSVSGSTGGPYTIEFLGARFTDTYVAGGLSGDFPVLTPFGDPTSLDTVQNGHSAPEVCTAAIVASCVGSTIGIGEGQLGYDPQVAVGPEGDVYVVDEKQFAFSDGLHETRVQRFESSGKPIAQTILAETQSEPRFAVDPNGDLHLPISSAGMDDLNTYDSSGDLLGAIVGTEITRPAIDQSGDVFVEEGEKSYHVITEYDAVGDVLRRFGYGNLGAVTGMSSLHNADGELYISEYNANKVRHLSFPSPGPVIPPTTCKASSLGSTNVTFGAEVNPEGKATTYHFEYVDDAHFQSEGGFASSRTKVTPESASIGSDFVLHAVDYQATGLTPETSYHCRVVATNSDASHDGEGGTFKTFPPLELGAAWVTGVAGDSASLHAELNPFGSPATGRFQYVEDNLYRQSGFADATEVPDVAGGGIPLSFGLGESMIARSVQLFSLVPGTTYHYRLLVSDPFTEAVGPAQTFITPASLASSMGECGNSAFRTGASAILPDCRAYEMVSPVDKNNGDIVALPTLTGAYAASLDQSALSGQEVTYTSPKAFGDVVGAPYAVQYIAARGEDGWSTRAVSPPRDGSVRAGSGNTKTDSQFKVFSTDLSDGWLLQDSAPLLAPGAVEGFADIYRRDNAAEGYEAVTTVAPPNLDLKSAVGYVPELQGVSADGSRAVFMADEKLTADASGAKLPGGKGIDQLYESLEGQLRLVSVLPNGKANAGDSSVGTGIPGSENRMDTVAHAMSADGSRIYWTAATEQSGQAGQGTLYVRVNPEREQSAIEAGKCTEPEMACTVRVSETVSGEPARFWTADGDGGKALFTIQDNGKSDLYEFDLKSDTSTLIASGVSGVVGTGEDLSRVYFVSGETLGGPNARGETPAAGKPNLYVEQAGASTFIATLSSSDATWDAAGDPVEHTARVSADGVHAVFMSDVSLTGYDNSDATSGEPDDEVYVYDADTRGLDCVSCNPTEGRPAGRYTDPTGRTSGSGAQRWIAAQIPGWETQFYAARVLSEDGERLFFDSYDALVPRDTNGREDVYEWEAASDGEECAELGAELFSASAGGCLSLISSGTSPTDSQFVDASATGGDVFFTTEASLVAQDTGLVDVYDARVDGGFPPPQNAPAACEGEVCQGAVVSPLDPTPASALFSGPGDPFAQLAAPVARRAAAAVKKKTAAEIRSEQLAKALTRCRSQRPKAKRRGCEALARERYAAKKTKTSNRRGK